MVNLAPADLRKEGPAYDLTIAVVLLAPNGNVPTDLDGSVQHVNRALPIAIMRGSQAVSTVRTAGGCAGGGAGGRHRRLPGGHAGMVGGAFPRLHNPIEPYRAQLDLEADPPAYATNFMDTNG